MQTPAKNLVKRVDLLPSDALLPLLECISNSIISLSQTELPVKERKINIEIVRGEPVQGKLVPSIKPIKHAKITDNGVGFHETNYESFKTPHSDALEDYGCLGVGRFSVLAAFRQMKIRSNFRLNGKWKYREFNFDEVNEVRETVYRDSEEKISETVVELIDLFNDTLTERTEVPLEEIATAIVKHFFLYHLSNSLPQITLQESGRDPLNVNEAFTDVAKEKERPFNVKGEAFNLYITRNPKTSNRRNHYYNYCADSRVVGRAKRLSKLDGIFSYPLINNHVESFLDVYVVGGYLDQRKYDTRNGFRIPATPDERAYLDEITLQDIGQQIAAVLKQEYSEYVQEAQNQDLVDWKNYIALHPRYNSLLNDEETLRSLPANTPDEKKEEELHRLIYRRQKTVEQKIEQFIKTKQIKEESIQEISLEIRNKTVLDQDALADYMARRKAVIDLLEKFLEADKKGDYRLEADIHNLVFPMGGTNSNTAYEAHNLWLLDERFASFQFIGSDKQIRTFSDTNSRLEPDLTLFNSFDNPIGYGDATHGDISALVIFEFKRPGEVAGKRRKNYRFEYSELTDKYFKAFRYGERLYNGKPVNVRQTTRKFGYIILSDIPEELENYNRELGWERTPFDTFYKMVPNSNMHLEAMKFDTLLRAARQRHMPFFDRLFVGNRHPTPLTNPANSKLGL